MNGSGDLGGSKGGTDSDGHEKEKVGMVREILDEARVEPIAMVMRRRRLEWFWRSWMKQGWNL